MKQNREYNPVACEHKLPNRLTAWQFQSEEQSNLNGGPNKVAVYVCLECGEISIGGYRTGADGSHNSFDEHFNIYCPDAIDAIIKQANFYNETAKWCRADDIAILQAKCERYEAALKWYADEGNYFGDNGELATAWKNKMPKKAIEALSEREGEKEPNKQIDPVELVKYVRENYRPSREVWKDKFGIALLSDEGIVGMFNQKEDKP